MNSYDGFEDLSQFTKQGLEEYRRMLLRKTEHQVEFILKHCPLPRPFSVLEYGCGNGRLLIGLANRVSRGRAILTTGLGLDLSRSRVEFATQWMFDWSKYLVFSSLAFEQLDILTARLGAWYGLGISITGFLNYFEWKDLLIVLREMSRNKVSLIELYKLPERLGKTWFELPKEDYWQYYLNDYIPTVGNDIIQHDKIFIGRKGQISKSTETLYYYSMPEFLDLCKDAGFGKVHWAVEDKTKFVVLIEGKNDTSSIQAR